MNDLNAREIIFWSDRDFGFLFFAVFFFTFRFAAVTLPPAVKMGVFCCVSDFLKTIGGSFDNVNYMYCSLAFVSAEFLFDTYLIWRQRRIVKETESPTEDVKKLMDNETYSKARWYSWEKINFGIIHDLYTISLKIFK